MIHTSKVDVAVYQKSKKRNYYNGDSYVCIENDEEFICAIADGLGSGEFAQESSRITIDIIEKNPDASVEQLVTQCNQELLGKRGVVLGILKLDYPSMTYSFSSIGNIGVMIINSDKTKKRNIPNSGYLAGYKRTIKVTQEKLFPGTNFIMFSDGIPDRDLSKKLFFGENVKQVIASYEAQITNEREDDTTLIAIRYKD